MAHSFRPLLTLTALMPLACAGRPAAPEPEPADAQPDAAAPPDNAASPGQATSPAPPVTTTTATTTVPAPEPTHSLALRESVRLGPKHQLRAQDIVVESIEASPDGSYPAGSGITVSLVMTRDTFELPFELSLLSAGYASHTVGWVEDHRFTLLGVEDPLGKPAVSLVVQRVINTKTDNPPDRGRISKDHPLTLHDGVEVTFLGHSHKRTHAGQTSPLMISLQWLAPDAKPVQDGTSLYPTKGDRSWRFRDRDVTLDDHRYGDWMDLTIQRLQLQRIERGG